LLGLPESMWIALLGLGVGALHMLAPDHWVPLTMYCHSRGVGTRRTALIAVAGGFAHVGGSVVATLLAAAVGLAVATGLSGFSNAVVGLSFVGVGLWMFVSGLRAGDLREEEIRVSWGVKWLVVTATSSPELTIFPILLAASVYGPWAEALSFSAFALGTVVSLVSATVAGVRGMGRFLKAPGRERQIDYAIAAILVSLGTAVLLGA
jgi:hypothetical protein